MKITAAHEFHHAIQSMYGDAYPSTHSINEMISTSMEYRLFPDSKDYHQYVRSLFRYYLNYPFGKGDYLVGYRYAIFGRYVFQHFGDSLFLRMWELIGNGVVAYKALDSSLVLNGTSLKQEWRKFMDWIYYTGSRSIENKYFSDANIFPELSFYTETKFTPPSIFSGGSIESFGFVPIRCYFPKDDKFSTDDTLDILLTNLDLDAAINQILVKYDYTVICTDSKRENTVPIEGTKYYYGLINDYTEIYDKLYFDFGVKTQSIGFAYPNPYKVGSDEKLFFPAPADSPLFEELELYIYTTEMTTIQSYKQKDAEVRIDNKNRVIILDKIPDSMKSGVYIYKIISSSGETFGKFTILR